MKSVMIQDTVRLSRAKQSLAAAQLDALVLRLPESIVMIAGIWPMCGVSHLLVTSNDGPVTLIAPSSEEHDLENCGIPDVRIYKWPRLDMDNPRNYLRESLQDLARKHDLTKARIGYEGSFEFVAPSHNAGEISVPCEDSIAHLKSCLSDVDWVDATKLLDRLRATKTSMEIERLRVANQVARLGTTCFEEKVEVGVTEAELASDVYRVCLSGGSALPHVKHVNVYPQIASGSNAHLAWRPIVSTSCRRIMPGDSVMLELAVCVDGYWADLTRTVFAGAPNDLQLAAFEAVKHAQVAAIGVIKPNVSACIPHQAANEILINAGFEKQIVHLTGHGLGFRYHESEPMLMPDNMQCLEVGHVCSVEPGLYSPRWGGVRLEHNVVVTHDGVSIL